MHQRLDPPRLTDMALAALEEVLAQCQLAPQPRSRSLALVLAYLASRRPEAAGRAAFDQFWRAIVKPDRNTRWQTANGGLNGIYHALGAKRDLTITSIFEGAAQAGTGDKAGRKGKDVDDQRGIGPGVRQDARANCEWTLAVRLSAESGK